jgi:hypothetical protein
VVSGDALFVFIPDEDCVVDYNGRTNGAVNMYAFMINDMNISHSTCCCALRVCAFRKCGESYDACVGALRERSLCVLEERLLVSLLHA